MLFEIGKTYEAYEGTPKHKVITITGHSFLGVHYTLGSKEKDRAEDYGNSLWFNEDSIFAGELKFKKGKTNERI